LFALEVSDRYFADIELRDISVVEEVSILSRVDGNNLVEVSLALVGLLTRPLVITLEEEITASTVFCRPEVFSLENAMMLW